MDTATLSALITSITGLVVAFISIGIVIWQNATSIATLKVKVDTMWSFQMRRAFAEVVNKELGDMKSPLKIFPQAMSVLSSFNGDLKLLYSRLKPGTSDIDAMIAIERTFGTRLTLEVCVPQKL